MRALLIASLCAAAGICAEETPVASLRLLALGELPPFRQEIRDDGMRYEIDPPEGSIPPRVLEADLPEKAEKTAKRPMFPVRLSSPSPAVKVFPVADHVKLSAAEQGEWLDIPCKPGTRVLAVIWRPASTWAKPAVLTLPDLGADHNPRTFRFVNVAPQTVGIVFGKERLQLVSGKSLSLTIPEGTRAVSVSVLFPGPSGQLTPCYSGLAEPRPGAATQYFVHRADGESPRRPIKVVPVSGPLAP